MSTQIRVIAETPSFVVLDKTPGSTMHRSAARAAAPMDAESQPAALAQASVLDDIRAQLDDAALFPVHRLDQGTSGLLLVAKGRRATALLSAQFRQRQVQKYYWAISERKARKKQGQVRGAMVKTRNGSWKLTHSDQASAITWFFSYGLGDGHRAYLLKPLTGKTHQLRVALKALAAPILGDTRYGGSASDRLYLHASHLAFVVQQQPFAYVCAPSCGQHFGSEAFARLFAQYHRPQQCPWPSAARRSHTCL